MKCHLRKYKCHYFSNARRGGVERKLVAYPCPAERGGGGEDVCASLPLQSCRDLRGRGNLVTGKNSFKKISVKISVVTSSDVIIKMPLFLQNKCFAKYWQVALTWTTTGSLFCSLLIRMTKICSDSDLRWIWYFGARPACNSGLGTSSWVPSGAWNNCVQREWRLDYKTHLDCK